MKSLDDYTIVITPDDGTWLAYAPAIEGLLAVGASPDEARRELQNVFEMVAEKYAEEGRELPGDVSELAPVAVK